MTLQRTLDQPRVFVAAGDHEYFPWVEPGLAQTLMLIELFARCRHTSEPAEHCSTNPAGRTQRCDPAGTQDAGTGHDDREEQHSTQEPERSARPDAHLDIVEHVVFFVTLEYHGVGVMDRHAEVFATQPDLAKVIDRGLCGGAISEDSCDVVVGVVLRGLFRGEDHPMQVLQDFGLVSGRRRSVRRGEGPQRHTISGRDRDQNRFIIGIGNTLEPDDLHRLQIYRIM